jgi:cytochrome c
MKRTAPLLALAIAVAALPALANEELARKSGCFACHAIDKKVVGPSYKEVAAKYKGDKDAEAKLFKKVKEGGVGVWGQVVPMPPNTHVKDEDIRTLVKWVLSQK